MVFFLFSVFLSFLSTYQMSFCNTWWWYLIVPDKNKIVGNQMWVEEQRNKLCMSDETRCKGAPLEETLVVAAPLVKVLVVEVLMVTQVVVASVVDHALVVEVLDAWVLVRPATKQTR